MARAKKETRIEVEQVDIAVEEVVEPDGDTKIDLKGVVNDITGADKLADVFYAKEKRWIKMSRDEVKQYTEQRVLIGYDPKRGIGLLKE